ncbi:MAG: DinB family protein [Ginsengibacter sp.]
MNLTQQIAKHFRDVHFGGNWAAVNLKDNLSGITWQQATTQVYNFNTIAALVYHMNYFVSAVLKVLQGEALDAHDKYSFDAPPILSREDWERLLDKTWADAENFAGLVEQLTENKLEQTFSDKKYGTYYRNINGIIEHMHYHLGQIVLIKKLLQHAGENRR